jgi:hypothetical protein
MSKDAIKMPLKESIKFKKEIKSSLSKLNSNYILSLAEMETNLQFFNKK